MQWKCTVSAAYQSNGVKVVIKQEMPVQMKYAHTVLAGSEFSDHFRVRVLHSEGVRNEVVLPVQSCKSDRRKEARTKSLAISIVSLPSGYSIAEAIPCS